ncbi:MAG: TonB family protein [Acidobacteriota bacterium]|nr:TonB family protein [Acidobacteriota bacterium]
MFDELVISGAKRPPTHTRWTFPASLAGELIVLSALLMVPTIRIQALPYGWREMSLLPPPAPGVAPRSVHPMGNNRPPTRLTETVAPFAPPRANIIHNPAPAKMAGGTGPLQLPGPIPGVDGDNPWTSILSQGSPVPPSNAQVLSVGGEVQSAMLIHMVRPEYPMAARKARVHGVVILRARIARDGTVVALRYISGPVMLVPAVEEAVRQWRYSPTLLNGQPVEVDTTITVIFKFVPKKQGKPATGPGSAEDIGSGE